MAKIILRCNYLKNAQPSHLLNFIKYIATREGVEKVNDTNRLLPETAPQKELIADILYKMPETKQMHEYADYCRSPTRENASEFITQALENNLDLIAKKKNYIEYLGNRPGVEKQGTHGLFSDSGKPVVLSQVADEVSAHKGVIWTNVISLRREDAGRLGYDKGEQWRELLRSKLPMLCKNFKIETSHLRWYAAFHNESHHPHVHLVVYSTEPSEGYLTRKGIEAMRAELAHDIFRQDFMHIYEKKTELRQELKKEAEETLLKMITGLQAGTCDNLVLAGKLELLSERLMKTSGRKVYGYLKKDVKGIVDDIIKELAKEPAVAACYEKWQEAVWDVLRIYKDNLPEQLPLWEQKELKSIKNMVIAEALKLGSGQFCFDDGECADKDDGISSDLPESEDDLPPMQTEPVPAGRADNRQEEGTAFWADMEEKHSTEKEKDGYYLDWSERYKEARGYLYGTEDCPPDGEAAYEIMLEEAEAGNALAIYDMGKIHQIGIFAGPDEDKAREWYHKSYEAFRCVEGQKSSAYVQYRIGKLYHYGLGVSQDYEEAARWYGMAAGAGNKFAQYAMGSLYYHGLGVEQDYQKALHFFQLSHDQGNGYASYELAKMYETGTGTTARHDKAEAYYRIAFLHFKKLEKDNQDDNLLYRIAMMYLGGKGTQKNESAAEKYLERAVKLGNRNAKYQLAKLYLSQEQEKLDSLPLQLEQMAVTPDISQEKVEQAVAWLKEAVEAGNANAAYLLGKLFHSGKLVPGDINEAIYYYTIAAEQGNHYAGYRLGRIFLSEEAIGGVPVYNPMKALHYLKKSAEGKNEYAAYLLGKLYLEGTVTGKDVQIALQYFHMTAEQGNQYAQYVLGKLYLMGKEIPKDMEKALYYLNQAAMQGNQYAIFLLEHWQDHPGTGNLDVILSATRLIRGIGNLFEQQYTEEKNKGGGTDRKLRRRLQQKKISQGHAEDDHALRM